MIVSQPRERIVESSGIGQSMSSGAARSSWAGGYRSILNPLSYVAWTERPQHIPVKDKLKGRRAKGMTYERGVKKQFERMIPKLWGSFLIYSGAWIHFIDKNGHGYAQPDMVIELADSVIIIEVKLTQTNTAEKQIKLLYLPLVAKLIPNKTIYLLQVCKNLRYVPKDGSLITKLEDVLGRPQNELQTLHYIL